MMALSCDLADDGKDGLSYDPRKGVNFTNKGDRAAVKYNFFKMTMSKESRQRLGREYGRVKVVAWGGESHVVPWVALFG